MCDSVNNNEFINTVCTSEFYINLPRQINTLGVADNELWTAVAIELNKR